MTVSLASYSASDPSFNLVTDKDPTNLLGVFGSYPSDILYQSFGLAAFIFPVCFIAWSVSIYKKGYLGLWPVKVILMILTCMVTAVTLSKANMSILSKLPFQTGGVIGGRLTKIIDSLLTDPFKPWAEISLYIMASLLVLLCTEIHIKHYFNAVIKTLRIIITTLLSTAKPLLTYRAKIAQTSPKPQAKVRYEPQYNKAENITTKTAPKSLLINVATNNNPDALPPVDLLSRTDNQNIKVESRAELQKNAEELLNVLKDFGVKGQIVDISQGPVVTLYEFEPAAGIKSSRVIGLADDIARSLSAVSTRIAVVQGRNALGIELPNKQRAFFSLRELIETSEYQDSEVTLPLILGKDLAGKPFITDLAKMPHLLVAGTTGSGKSVAINAMILSLLYRYTPKDCRLIMIDPKMLELSVYDNIPHLLTPVVTEPNKAVIALKWAVREMENRYRLMSNLGVRNISGYNFKIAAAAKEGKKLTRTVQTGFDPETGKPVYDSIEINMTKLPFIVIIVDEMADLMIVAGKDIESSVQRLAQMARAAGIHIIMATQRPSVDVITGVIKANFPSRVSFKVTSRIDSRTIIGEQGAEQLLGMGDMLFMGHSSKITRVHGPFVNDNEVETVTGYLRSTGTPEYISSVTEQPDEDEADTNDFGNDGDDGSLYNQAVQIVRLERKVSTSYIQRSLRIGYNRAADIIDKMEKAGLISAPNHAGKREILMPEG